MPRKPATPKANKEAQSTERRFAELLARCVASSDESAWRLLADDLRKCASRVAPQIFQEAHRKEFVDWFLGWPRLQNAVALAYQGVRELAARKPSASYEEQRQYFLNYMTRVAKSALHDYIAEGFPRRIIYAEDLRTPENHAGASSETRPVIEIFPDTSTPEDFWLVFREEERDVRARLAVVPLQLRVPFLLTYLIDMISEEELEWIAAQRKTSAQEVARLIEEERAAHFDRQYPLSSAFIGALLGVSPDVVSQRVRRARLLLEKSYRQSRA